MTGGHWTTTVLDILLSDKINLRDLAYLAGADPAFFYRGANLEGCDLSGQDLRGMDFSGSNINRAKIDEHTVIDEEFRPVQSGDLCLKKAEISRSLYDFLENICILESIRFRSRSLRFLVQLVHDHGKRDPDLINALRREIYSNVRLSGHFDAKRTIRMNMAFKISRGEHEFALRLGKIFHGKSAGYNGIVLLGAMIYFGRAPAFDAASKLVRGRLTLDYISSEVRRT